MTLSEATSRGDQGALRLRGIKHTFGAVLALDGINLEVQAGQFVTLLGPSGCGKSTLLRIVAGLEEPDAGEVILSGKDLLTLPPERRPVNLVFQRYALFPHRDVWGNVAFGLEVAGVPREEAAERVAQVVATVQLSGLEHRRVDELSGGQQQRVALARAVVKRPQLLLLDEPLGALDQQLRKSMQLELRELRRAIDGTFIYVTHDQEEALTMSDRIVVMREGQIEQAGTPSEVYHHPSSRFVAGFVGETNMLEGVADARGVHLDAGGVMAANENGAQGRVTVSVRPEHVTLGAREACTRGAPTLSGRIEDVIFLGSVVRYRVSIEGHRSVFAQESGTSALLRRAGDRIVVSWDPVDAAVLDR